MIVTDKFVFAHLARSGGTFVSDVIRKFFPSAHEIGHHLPRELLPREYFTSLFLVQSGTLGNSTSHCITTCGPEMSRAILVSWMSENGRLNFVGSIETS